MEEEDVSSPPSKRRRSEGSSMDRVNPFEPFCLRNLKSSIFSPSIFQEGASSAVASEVAASTGVPWGIHEMAVLFPRPLESSPSSHTNPYPLSVSQERMAQQDIFSFFSQEKIAPTPDHPNSPLSTRRVNLFVKGKGGRRGSWADSWTNTEISLPPVLPPDLEEMLEKYKFMGGDCCSETMEKERATRLPLTVHEWSTAEEEEEAVMDENGFSVRRKLQLSFGEMPSGISPVSSAVTPIRGGTWRGDPFGDNHEIISPVPMVTTPKSFVRSEMQFTPEGGRRSALQSPNITPIRSSPASNSSGSSRGRPVQSPLCSSE